MTRHLFIFAAVALLCGCSGPKVKISYGTETVQRGQIFTSVTATGTIEPVTEVQVGTQVSGIIDRIYVDYNSEVHKGQLIAELDKTNLSSRLAAARSQLASALSDYQYQQTNLRRMQQLHDKQFISDDEFETARLAHDKSKAQYEAQQLTVQEAQTNLGYAYIYSPIDGVILSREVEEGQTVAASMNTPTLFTIAKDLTDMRVIADVDEADIGGVHEGQRVVFAVDAFPNDSFEGHVTQVRQKPTTTSNVVTYEVVISAPNPDLKLKPGLTANVTIYTMELHDVLCVSAKALRYQPRESALMEGDTFEPSAHPHQLWVRQGNTLRAIAVEVGTTNGLTTQLTGGIDEGTEVISETIIDHGPMPQQQQLPFMPGPPGNKKK